MWEQIGWIFIMAIAAGALVPVIVLTMRHFNLFPR
jgi:hypothetical protein